MGIRSALGDVALTELANNQFDICRRAFMIASALLADFDRVLAENNTEMIQSDAILAFCSPIILHLRSTSMKVVPCEQKKDRDFD